MVGRFVLQAFEGESKNVLADTWASWKKPGKDAMSLCLDWFAGFWEWGFWRRLEA